MALPITRMTLYKHGVGFFERRAVFSGEEVRLSFRVSEMNDVLKSLTVLDAGDGQVLGVDYATPQGREEQLEGCSVRLGDRRSLRDLLVGLRGRKVSLLPRSAPPLTGTLLGLDEADREQPLTASLISLLLEGTDSVHCLSLGELEGVTVLDERGAADLRFFLETALTQENYRNVTIRLTPGDHDLQVSYLAPSPTWRVSYRLVLDAEEATSPDGTSPESQALLLGWGIFDNRLEEDLEGISLSLVAGMPISFVYDLYQPFTPERPLVQEEARVTTGPVLFEAKSAMPSEHEALEAMASARRPIAPAMRAMALSPDQVQSQVAVEATGAALGELFQYVIQTPVTVGRGQSAMVPVVSTRLRHRKDLLYNAQKMAGHPVATLRMQNTSGLTLERGPVTVLEGGEYVGEAVLSLTAAEGEIVVAYAVELGVLISEHVTQSRQLRGVSFAGHYVQIEEWETRHRRYQCNNKTDRLRRILIEHPRQAEYELFDSPEPAERTEDHWRFEIELPAWEEVTLVVRERKLLRRQEELRRQSHQALQRYLNQGLLDRRVYDQVSKLLLLYDSLADYEQKLQALSGEREAIYEAQRQIQGNMGVLQHVGKEGVLREQYVDQLRQTEQQLAGLQKRESELRTAIKQVNEELEARLKALG